MKEMIKVNMNNINRPTVLGRDLHKFLSIKTRYDIWFDRMLEYGFEQDKDYYIHDQKCTRIGKQINEKRTIINHQLTLNMAKEIGMVQRNDTGKKIRNYFIKCEDMLKDIIKNKEINNNSNEWKKLRAESKSIRFEETNEIQRMVKYAEESGSENANNYYTHFSKLVWDNLFLIEKGFEDIKNKKDICNDRQLATVIQAENIIRKSINEGLKNETEYHEIYYNTRDKIKLLASLVEITKIPYYSQISMI